ncbi:MAG: HyaD/HybD family hydrogenase maturation endopeptidase [Chitinophagaceae bacterium]
MNTKKILIMGIGNYLMADEGVGVHAAEQLQQLNWPENVSVLDGGTGGFHLLEYFETHDHVILIDATLDGREPGTIRKIKPRFAKDFPPAMSTHDIGLKDMVSALQFMDKMPVIDLYVVSIASIQEQGIQLTEPIRKVLPEIVAQVRNLVLTACLEPV